MNRSEVNISGFPKLRETSNVDENAWRSVLHFVENRLITYLNKTSDIFGIITSH